jgi:hypothetical protein
VVDIAQQGGEADQNGGDAEKGHGLVSGLIIVNGLLARLGTPRFIL